jgi:hypothetical protein
MNYPLGEVPDMNVEVHFFDLYFHTCCNKGIQIIEVKVKLTNLPTAGLTFLYLNPIKARSISSSFTKTQIELIYEKHNYIFIINYFFNQC